MQPRTVALSRNGHIYVFRYWPGHEDAIIDEIMRLAQGPDTDLDWIDAARLSFQITQQAVMA